MSILLRNLESRLTGRGFAEIPKLNIEPLVSAIPQDSGLPLLREYEFLVTWQARAHLRPGQFDAMLESVRRLLRNDLYGDARNIVDRLEHQLLQRETDKALAVLRELREEMGY